MSLVELTMQYPDTYEPKDQEAFVVSALNTETAFGPSISPRRQGIGLHGLLVLPEISNAATHGTNDFTYSTYVHGTTILSKTLAMDYSMSWHPLLVMKKRDISNFAPFVQIPHLLEQIADDTAFKMLVATPSLIGHATTLCKVAQQRLLELGLTANWQLTTFNELEGEGQTTLVLECRLQGKDYRELLSLWGKLSLELFANIPLEAQKKIALVMDES